MAKYKMVCTDIDGTLINTSHTLSQKTKNTVKKAVEEGVVFTLVSARPPEGMFYLNEEIGIEEYIVSFGGSLILKKGQEPLYADVLDTEQVMEVYEMSRKTNLNLSIYEGERLFVESIDWRVELEHKIARAVPEIADFQELFQRGIRPCKLLYLGEPEEIQDFMRQAQERFQGRLNIYTSKPDYLEVCPLTSTKMGGIERLAEHYGIAREEIIAIGDQFNDLSMIEQAGLGIAMGNAPDGVKKKADFVTLDNDQDGVAYAIEKFIFEG